MNRFLKHIGIILLIHFTINATAGCDMCSMYLGLHPNQTKNSISMRYRFSLYESSLAHNHNGGNQSSITGTEWRTFQTIETWSQWRIGRKLQILVMMPYAMNSIENKGLVLDAFNSIGDVQGLARYQVYRSDEKDHNYVHRLIIGLGLKAPTGKYNIASDEGTLYDVSLDPHIQTGTGSWDLIYNVGYLLKYNQWGINEEILYKQNGINSNAYHFANRFSSNSSIYYNFEKNDFNIMPSIGYLYEYAGMDQSNKINQTNTNGSAHYVVPGIDVYYKKLTWNISYQKAFIEHLRDANMSNRYRWLIGMGYSF